MSAEQRRTTIANHFFLRMGPTVTDSIALYILIQILIRVQLWAVARKALVREPLRGEYLEKKKTCSSADGKPRRCLDVSRAEKEFGFRAKVGLKEGLQRTIDFYRDYKGIKRSGENEQTIE